MKTFIEKKAAVITAVSNLRTYLIVGTGIYTFFFGFGAGALLNIYLLAQNSPLVTQLRSSLTYKSSIFGDGIILPIINMVIVSFLLDNQKLVTRRILTWGLVLGIIVTLYFNITQAVEGLVNWAMPTPWHWNILGAWHAVYMFSVSALISVFYLVVFIFAQKQKRIPKELLIVSFGIIIFFVLLRLDYTKVNLSSVVPFSSFGKTR